MSGFFLGGDLNKATLPVVADGILHQILQQLLQKLPVTQDCGLPAEALQAYPPLPGGDLQIGADLFGKAQQLHTLGLGGGLGAVQLGELDDVIDEIQKAGCVFADFSGKTQLLISIHHFVFNQLGIAGNGGKRRFQLVRHIGRKFSAQLFPLLPLRYIHSQYHRAGDLTRGQHGAGHDG